MTTEQSRLPARSLRRARLGLACLVWVLALGAGAAETSGAETPTGGFHQATEGNRYWVSRFELESAGPGLGAALDWLREREFAFGTARDGYVGPRRGGRNVWFRLGTSTGQNPVPVYASGLRELSEQIVGELNARGEVGAYVAPHPQDIDPATGADLRPSGRGALRLRVYATGPPPDIG